MKKSWEQIHQELSAPFSHEDVEWKIQTVSKDKSRGLAVAYVTARAIQNRLDAVVGSTELETRLPSVAYRHGPRWQPAPLPTLHHPNF